jgi:O-6-methylguanine DNA methyltransferase
MEENREIEDVRLLGTLRRLGPVSAPESLLPAVLGRVGLADVYWQVETVLGPTYVAYNAAGVSAVMQEASDDGFETAFRTRFGRPAHRAAAPPAAVAGAIERRLAGDAGARLSFDLRPVSGFGRAVLMKALQIPQGEVRPYAWVAREIGHPRAVRAVGTALGRNPIPILIPCHRVVRSDGTIGDYALGRQAKAAILDAEGVDLAALQRLARSGVRYIGSDSTHVFCLPACRHAWRISEPHRVLFPSHSAAVAAGYRPCKSCRPVA